MHMARSSSRWLVVGALIAAIAISGQLGCGKRQAPMSEYQDWLDYTAALKDMLDISTEAFYRVNLRLPSSLDELRSSQWLWFEPVAPTYAPGFEVVDRPLEVWEKDRDKVQLSFDGTGFTFSYYLRKSQGAGDPHLVSTLSDKDALKRYEQIVLSDKRAAIFDVTNVGYIRQNLAYAISMRLARNYFSEHHGMPRKAGKLYESLWTPNEEVFGALEVIGEGRPFGVYVGFANKGDNGVYYYEIVRADGSTYVEQRMYRIEPAQNATAIRESLLEGDQRIKREDTVPFIDSTLHGWGIL